MTLLPEVELTTDEQKASYGFGLQFGEQLRRNSFDGLDLEAALAGQGFTPHATPLDEFIKAGGSAKCLTLRLDGEDAAGWRKTG